MQLVTEAHTVDSWGRHAGRKVRYLYIIAARLTKPQTR